MSSSCRPLSRCCSEPAGPAKAEGRAASLAPPRLLARPRLRAAPRRWEGRVAGEVLEMQRGRA
eukprot:11368969-Alexandrium_andersonii.AAC.1